MLQNRFCVQVRPQCNVSRLQQVKSVRRKENMAFQHKDFDPAGEHGGRGIMSWTCFGAFGPVLRSDLCQLKGNFSMSVCESQESGLCSERN